MLILVNFSNSWPGSLDQKHYIWKIHETQSPANQMLRNESSKKNAITQKGSKSIFVV